MRYAVDGIKKYPHPEKAASAAVSKDAPCRSRSSAYYIHMLSDGAVSAAAVALGAEPRQDALDRAARAERLAAAHAIERLLLLDHQGAARGFGEVEPRLQRDDVLRAGVLAQAALDAGVLLETELRRFGIVLQRPGRTGADAGEAERAARDIDDHGAEQRLPPPPQ